MMLSHDVFSLTYFCSISCLVSANHYTGVGANITKTPLNSDDIDTNLPVDPPIITGATYNQFLAGVYWKAPEHN